MTAIAGESRPSAGYLWNRRDAPEAAVPIRFRKSRGHGFSMICYSHHESRTDPPMASRMETVAHTLGLARISCRHSLRPSFSRVDDLPSALP